MSSDYTLAELNQLIEDIQPGDVIPQRRWWNDTQVMRLHKWLAESAVWCTHRLDLNDLGNSLRSLDLINPLSKSRFHTVYDCNSTRKSVLQHHKLNPIEIPYDLILSGRLLVYYPEMNLADGAAYVATDGFLDNNNMPPWDSWLDYFEEPYDESQHLGGTHNYLISWVPAPLIDKVTKGIEWNPEKCIEWLDESNVVFRIVWEESLKLLHK